MKKVLLGASAIIGAASLAAPAVAAEAPSISFTGAMAYEIVAHDADVQAAGTGLNITANEQQSELGWKGRGTADNGLEYGANIEWRWANGGSGAGGFDESWMDFKGSFGRVYLGAEDGVTDLVASSSAQTNQVGAWGTDGNNALRNVNTLGLGSGTHYYINHAGNTGDTNKIGYITPSFGGFQAGVSFSPEGNEGVSAGVNNGSRQNAWEFAAAYSGQFDAVSFKVDAAYGYAEDNTAVAGATDIDSEDIGAYQLGAEVGVAGFMIAASYGDNDDSGCADNVANCDAGDFWDFGGKYTFGAAAVSASYQEGEDDLDGNGNSDESEIFHAGFNYKVADGLSVHANYYNMSFTNEAGAATETNNDADVLILGSRITF